jgi:hypothetical protein
MTKKIGLFVLTLVINCTVAFITILIILGKKIDSDGGWFVTDFG